MKRNLLTVLAAGGQRGFKNVRDRAVKAGETLERLEGAEVTRYTPLKRGVNETPYPPLKQGVNESGKGFLESFL